MQINSISKTNSSSYRFITQENKLYSVTQDGLCTPQIQQQDTTIEIYWLASSYIYFIQTSDIPQLKIKHQLNHIAHLREVDQDTIGICYQRSTDLYNWDQFSFINYTRQPKLADIALLVNHNRTVWYTTAPITQLLFNSDLS